MRVTPALLTRLGTAALSDALGKKGAMQHQMQCRSAYAKMAGPARTLQLHTADILMVPIALADCPKGHVLVIGGQGERNTALWGELTTYSAHGKGLAGVVIDGAIRDAAQIRRSRLPVFACATVPNAGGGEYVGAMNVTLSCAGQVVRPGDWLVGDEDGVVVIPAERLEETAALAAKIVAAEKRIERKILKGANLCDLIGTRQGVERKRSEVFVPQLRSGIE